MPIPSPDGGLKDRIHNLLAQDRKLEAVKTYREQTGVSLMEAKTAVEAMEAGIDLPSQEITDSGDIDAEILSMLRQGPKLEAVKRYRQRTSCSLMEAKQAVESIAAKSGIVVDQSSGCVGVIVVLVILAVVAVVAVSMFVSGNLP